MRSDDEQVNEIEELREQLAAANALLRRVQLWRPPADQDPRTYDAGQRKTLQLTEDILAHLAAQPATAPAHTRAEEAAAKRRERSLKGAATRRANAAGYSPENEDAMTYGVGEPATAPARDEAEPNTHRRGCVCVRCEAEQAVLDAMAKADIYQDTRGAAVFAIPSEEGDICRAELARRGLK